MVKRQLITKDSDFYNAYTYEYPTHATEGDLANPEYYLKCEDFTKEENDEVRKFLEKLTKAYNKISKEEFGKTKDTGKCPYTREYIYSSYNCRQLNIYAGLFCSGPGMSGGDFCERTSTWWARGFRRINGKLLISRLVIYTYSDRLNFIDSNIRYSEDPEEFIVIGELEPMADKLLN